MSNMCTNKFKNIDFSMYILIFTK